MKLEDLNGLQQVVDDYEDIVPSDYWQRLIDAMKNFKKLETDESVNEDPLL